MRCGFEPWRWSVGWGSSVAESWGVGGRRGLGPTLLRLWRRLVAAAPIRPLAWELPYAMGLGGEKKKKKTKACVILSIIRIVAWICFKNIGVWGACNASLCVPCYTGYMLCKKKKLKQNCSSLVHIMATRNENSLFAYCLLLVTWVFPSPNCDFPFLCTSWPSVGHVSFEHGASTYPQAFNKPPGLASVGARGS